MFELILFAVTVAPLIGIIMMELGAYGPDVYQIGYPNGASYAYAVHLAVLWVVFLATRRAFTRLAIRKRLERPETVLSIGRFRYCSSLVLIVNGALLLFVVYVVGAKAVLAGSVAKGEFRSTLGVFGPVAYLIRDFLTPTLVCVVAFLYTRINATFVDRVMMGLNLLVAAMAGAVWGFKASAIMLLIPPLVLLWPRVGPVRVFVLVVVGFAMVLSFTIFFEGIAPSQATGLVLIRATIGTGNTAWKLWDLELAGTEFPSYASTLLSAAGGRISRLAGLYASGDVDAAYNFDFSSMTTLVVGGWARDIDVARSNVTSTAFGEGIFALGSPGFLVFSVLAGLVASLNRAVIARARRFGSPLMAAFGATYFITSTFTWLNSGGLTALFILPFIANYTISIGVAAGCLWLSGIPLNRGLLPGSKS